MRLRLLRTLAAWLTITLGVVAMPALASPPMPLSAQDFAAVIAVIDSGLSPYHFDFLASTMPSTSGHLAKQLTRPPDRWLPGFPRPAQFASYKPLSLTLPTSPGQSQEPLHRQDAARWNAMQPSGNGAINYRWIPGTKIIGALTFGSAPGDKPIKAAITGSENSFYGQGGSEHGMGSASVAVGNIHGACPECLLVFLKFSTYESGERALAWANQQPWIDAVTNSYSFGTGPTHSDNVYHGPGVEGGKSASLRGQTVFFSAGNGIENEFIAPASTLLSSQKGPDWIVTVAATSSRGRDYPGTGKPADVAGIGSGHPSAFDSLSATDGTPFTGTSSAAPQVTGTYAHALATIRSARGWIRSQDNGVVARAPGCSRVSCRLTATRLREALMEGAQPTGGSMTDPDDLTETPALADSRFADEGYGTYRGLLDGRGSYEAWVQQRIVRPVLGLAARPKRPAEEQAWFRVDSWCRQHIWGNWAGGAFRDNGRTPLPPLDPAWPTRTALLTTCPALQAPPSTLF